MKKSIFILAALFAATSVNSALIPDLKLIGKTDVIYPAQWIFNQLHFETSQYQPYAFHVGAELPCPFYVRIVEDSSAPEGARYTLLNASDYSTYRPDLNLASIFGENKQPVLAAYDIFAVDKLAYIIKKSTSSSSSSDAYYQIIDEDNNILLDLGNASWYINKYGDTWKLIVVSADHTTMVTDTEIYVLPGDGSMPGSSQAVSNPSAQRANKKIIREGQVFVETENSTYDLRGQEVR